MVNQDTKTAEKQDEYYVTIDRNGTEDDIYTYTRGTDGTEDEITIHNPYGGLMAVITFWHDEGDSVEDAERNAQLIVDALNAYKSTDDRALTHEELRKRHYERLNDYRNSVEYQASRSCAHQFGYPTRILLGDRWKINEEIYNDALECLPPLGWRGGTFYMREFSFDDITAKFTKEGSNFYCEFARFPGRAAA